MSPALCPSPGRTERNRQDDTYRTADQVVLRSLQDRAAGILEDQQAMPDNGAVQLLREIVKQAWEHTDRWTAEGR